MESSTPDIAGLLTQAQQGDQEAFNALCREFKPRLFRQGILMCGDVSLTEDLVQETLVEAWKCLGRYDGRCLLFTWLCAIFHNRYRNWVRRRQLLSFFGLFGTEPGELPERIAYPECQEPWPDRVAQEREQAALVRGCIRALPRKQQEVVYLRFFVDDSLQGIAAALGCSVGTIKSRLFHALDRLRAMPALREEREDLE